MQQAINVSQLSAQQGTSLMQQAMHVFLALVLLELLEKVLTVYVMILE
jgi:hypothetical protein